MEEISGDNTHKKHRRTAKLPAFYLVWLLVSLGGTKFHLFPEERPGVSLDVRLAEGSRHVPAKEVPKSGHAGWARVSGGREGGRVRDSLMKFLPP